MLARSLAIAAATCCAIMTLPAVAFAELSIEKAQELSQATGRPILAVAGTKT